MMRFYTDDYFHIGAAHLGAGSPCQDYALSQVLENGAAAYAIVSDGCSTGGRTDSGARVVAHTTEVAIRDDWQRTHLPDVSGIPEIVMQQKVLMQNARYNLGLMSHDLLATCSYAYVSENSGYVLMRGDGVIATVSVNGSIIMRRFDWANNRPLYPEYVSDNFKAFTKAHGSVETQALTEEIWTHSSQNGFVRIGTSRYTVSQGINGTIVWLSAEENNLQDYAYIAVLTDGVTQVDGVDWKDAVVELLSFKNVAGAFGKRRMIRFIKDKQKIGKGPIDDIAYAVIRVGKEEDNVT